MLIELIAAVANDGVIGYKGNMPWGRIKADLEYFKSITMGHTIVMGYKTLVSIGKDLPGRKVLVLTHRPEKLSLYPWCNATDIDAVLEMAQTERVIIAGGGDVYRQFLPYATVARVTRIQASFEGDVRFPELPATEWKCLEVRFHYPNGASPYPLRFETWHRNKK